MPRGHAGGALTEFLDATFPPARGLVAGSYGEASPALRLFVRQCGAMAGEREWQGMGARSAVEAGGIIASEMQRRLSVVTHAAHMRVIYGRLHYAGMSVAQAARGAGAGRDAGR